MFLFLFRNVVQSNEACVDLYIINMSEITSPKLHREIFYTNYMLYGQVEMYVRTKRCDTRASIGGGRGTRPPLF